MKEKYFAFPLTQATVSAEMSDNSNNVHFLGVSFISSPYVKHIPLWSGYGAEDMDELGSD